MTRWVHNVISRVDGAEEFVYLLGACLLNYGSVITDGIYHHARLLGGQSSGNPQDDKDAMNENRVYLQEQETRRSEASPPGSKQTSMDTTSFRSSRRGNESMRKILGQPPTKRARVDKISDKDDHARQLRETIRGIKVDLQSDEAGTHDLSDVAGLEEIKKALEEFACFFLHFPHLTRDLRQRSTTGILLFGPQGTGKTLIVRSFARRYNLALYDVRASAIMSKYVGEAEKFVQALFEEVRADAPAVLMLDECDGLLCNPTSDMTQSHSYRLLQNELKNQWSDLIYSRDEVIIIGATNKPHDMDMDGFGRRLSLKLYVDLPSQAGCQVMLEKAMSRVRHTLSEEEMETLGMLCHEKGLSGYDIECLVEALLRRALHGITSSQHFRRREWQEGTIVVPCGANEPDAMAGPWNRIASADAAEMSYVPFTFQDVHGAVLRARATVDAAMRAKHNAFASQYGAMNGEIGAGE